MKYSQVIDNMGCKLHAILTSIVIGCYEGEFVLACEVCNKLIKINLRYVGWCKFEELVLKVASEFKKMCKCKAGEHIDSRLQLAIKETLDNWENLIK